MSFIKLIIVLDATSINIDKFSYRFKIKYVNLQQRQISRVRVSWYED